MLRKILFASVLAIPLFCVGASAQTADDLVGKYVTARGGLEKLKALKTVTMTGVSIVGPGLQAPTVLQLKRQNSMRIDMTVMDKAFVQASNGATAWGINPFDGSTGAQVMPEADSKAMIEESDIDGPLVDYKAKGTTVELVGKEPLDGTDAYKLKVTLKSGRVIYFYLDAGTYLERKSVGKRKVQGSEVEVVSLASDYKAVEGVLFPFTVENRANGETLFHMSIATIEVNKPIDDAVFAFPSK